MINLYGTSISNYYSTAKAALLEKNLAFTEVQLFPGQNEEILRLNPMGKVPFIEVDGQMLSETNVLFDYFEELQPDPPLYPTTPWARAKARELVRVVELYLDAPARRHIAVVYFGAAVDPETAEAVRPELEKGLRALRAMARFQPYIAGETFGYADISAYFQLRFANLHTEHVYGWDLTADVPGLKDYLEHVGTRPHIRAVDERMRQDFTAFKNR